MLEQFYKYYKNKSAHRMYSRGVSLIEVVLALALFSAIAGLVFGGQWSIADQILENMRTVYALHTAETSLVSILKDSGSPNHSTGALPRWPVMSSGLFDTLHSLSVLPFSRCEKLLEHSTSWRTGWGTVATTSLSFVSADVLRANMFGKDCGGHSKNFSESGFQQMHEADLGSPAATVDSFKQYSFVGMRPAIGQPLSAPDLVVVSANESFQTASIDIPMGETNGVNKLDIIDGFIFAANNSSTTQIAILSFDSGATGPGNINVQVLATSTLPGVAGVRPEAVSIFYSDSKIYVGTKRTVGHEFHVFDVSNPEHPQWLGSREMNHNINDIVVVDGYAFLATSGNVRDLIVLDIRDPMHISEALTVDLPGTEDGRSVQVSAGYVFLGRYKGTQPGRNELWMLRYWRDADSSPLQMEVVDSITAGADIVAISVAQGKVIAATTHPQKELQIFEFGRDQSLVLAFTKNMSVAATGLDIDGSVVSVTSGNSLVFFAQE